MKRALHRLSPLAVKNVAKPGLHADGGGLYLRVAAGGSKSWVVIFQWRGKRREMGLGGLHAVSLARAREKAAAVRSQVADGVDPIDAKRAARELPTFGLLADDWITAQTPRVKSDKSVARWKRALSEGGYSDSLRSMRVDDITTDHVLAVLTPIWHEKAATARTVRVYIEAVLDAAKARKLRSGDNPAAWAGNLEPLLGATKRGGSGHAAVPWREMPSFMADLRTRPALAARALEFIILTAARTSEGLGATWGEIDFKAKTWTVPKERMKSGVEHTVPLSDAALGLLTALKPEEPAPGAYVFGGKKALSNMACAMLMRRMGRSETVHGTARSSFRDWAGSGTHYPRELAEEALAHAVGDATERAYRRETAIERRRPMMTDWADYLAGSKGENVVPIRASAA